MFVKCISVVVCTICFLYTFYILCNLTYFLSNMPNKNKETITSSEKGK